jgi:signal peptidase I
MVHSLPRASRVVAFLVPVQLLLAGILVMVAGGFLAALLPGWFNYESYIVRSGSMEPTIQVGDLAVAAPARPADLTPGDIIVYRPATRPDVIITHRLVGIEPDPDGGLNFRTRGDANDSVDQVLVSEQALMGRIVYTLPKLGYLADFARQPGGRLLLIVLPVVILVGDFYRRQRRRTPSVSPEQSIAMGLVIEAQWAAEAQTPERALQLLDKAIATAPKLADPWLVKAELLAERTEQEACLRAGLLINPTSLPLTRALNQLTAHETSDPFSVP